VVNEVLEVASVGPEEKEWWSAGERIRGHGQQPHRR
jgi:hypothetical protein